MPLRVPNSGVMLMRLAGSTSTHKVIVLVMVLLIVLVLV